MAFSGAVQDGGASYTEAGMNGFPELQTARAFDRPEYRFLIVAYKFQTGFDQPLLHTMYVDQKLGGVRAVQTLSRLNRVHPQKEETLVLDFANEADEIQKAFQPYYEKTILDEATDPNALYDLQHRLEAFHVFGEADVDRFAELYFNPRTAQAQLYAALEPVRERFEDLEEAERVEFRGCLNDYVRLYAFLGQVITFTDADLEKLYVFARLLRTLLPVDPEDLPREVQQMIDMESYRIDKRFEGAVSLERRLSGEEALVKSILVNTPDNARLTFNHVVSDRLQEMVDTNFEFYKRVTDDREFAGYFLEWLFDRFRRAVEG